MTKDELPNLLTPKVIADYLQLSKQQIHRMLSVSTAVGGIPNFVACEGKTSKTRRVHKDKFLAWLDSRETNEAQQESGLGLMRRAR